MKKLFLLSIIFLPFCTTKEELPEIEPRSQAQCNIIVERITFNTNARTAKEYIYTLSVTAHTTDSTKPSLKMYARCGNWIFEEWQCINLPHTGEAVISTICPVNESIEIYGEWYSGPDCTGAKCDKPIIYSNKPNWPPFSDTH